MKAQTKKEFRFLICCLLGIALFFASCKPIAIVAAKLYVNWSSQRRMLPEDGLYINEELNMKLDFTGEGVAAEFADGSRVRLHVTFSGELTNTKTGADRISAGYLWKQHKNEIVLKFSEFPDPEVAGKEFVFTKCDVP